MLKPLGKPTSFSFLYTSQTNLYGFCMQKPLPSHGFEFLQTNEWYTKYHSFIRDVQTGNISMDDAMRQLEVSDVNFFLEIDVNVPIGIHDKVSDFPLLPEVKTPPGGKFTKLIADLTDKKSYVVSFLGYLMALQQGYNVTTIHRVLRYYQSPWLRSYINFNTEERRNATDQFSRDFWKFMNNALFGELILPFHNYHIVIN
jgi:hypothetical protein